MSIFHDSPFARSRLLLAFLAPLALSPLGACGGDIGKDGETGDTDTGNPDSGDTETGETGETDTGETGETDTGETGDTGETADTSETGDTADTADTGDTGVEATPVAVELEPVAMTLGLGTSYTWTATVIFSDRTTATPPCDWTVDDAAIATVDAAGTVTTLAVGTTGVHATFRGLTGDATLDVIDGAMVTVYSSMDLSPIAGATVEASDGTSAVTDASGVAMLSGIPAGPLTFTAVVDDTWTAVSYLDVSSRELRIPLTPKGSSPTGTLQGNVDFGGVADAAWDELAVGVVPAAVQGALGTYTLDRMFGDDRTVTLFGTDLEVPGNIVVEGTVENYETWAYAGPIGIWAFAGPVSIADASGASGSTADALNLLIGNLGDMTWGWNGSGHSTIGATTTLDIAPSVAFSDSASVSLPALPLGFRGDETWLVMSAEECTEGWAVTGFGTGTGAATVTKVPDGSTGCGMDLSMYATAEVGGLGTGGATSTTLAHMDRGAWVFNTPQAPPSVDAWDPATRALTISADPAADFVRIRMTDDRNNVHDYYVSGSWSGTVPGDYSGFRRPQADIEVFAIDSERGTWEDRVMDGDIEPDAFLVNTSAKSTWTH